MKTPLTPTQAKLLHTQCPNCNESELSALDSIQPDAPFLWCPNCEITIDGYGTIEQNPSTEYIHNPEVCPSSLNEWGKPVDMNETAHKWDDTISPVTCAECGTEKITV